MRGEFALDLCALIAGCARQVFLRVVQFVGVELQLRLGDLEIGVAIRRRGGLLSQFRGLPGGGVSWLDKLPGPD